MKVVNKKKFMKFMEIFIVYVVLLIIEYSLEKNNVFHMFCSDDFGTFQIKDWNLAQIFIERSYKYRPISLFLIHIFLKIFPFKIYYFGYFLLALNTIIAMEIYWILVSEKCNRLFSLIVASVYLCCRFSYYQTTQLLGMLEGICTFLGMLLVYSLYKYNMERKDRWFYLSLIFYILISLSHERYAVMIVPLFFIWCMCFIQSNKSKKEIKKIGIGILSIAIMVFLLKNRTDNIWVGTGGTDVSATFSLHNFLEMVKKSLLYLASINGDDVYLSLVSWNNTPGYMKWVVKVTIIVTIILFITAVWESLHKEKKIQRTFWTNIVLFASSIGVMTIISSSTIRVEMRWMYFPYVVLLLLLVYLCYFIKEKNEIYYIKKEMFLLYAFGIITFNLFARQYYGNLYYWADFTMGNSLATATYKNYGDELEGKKLIIITDYVIKSGGYTYKDMIDSLYEDVDLVLLEDASELQNIENIDNSVVLQWNNIIFGFDDITNTMG